jgi:hypothetical protein
MSPAWLLVMLTIVPGQSPVAKDDPAPEQAARIKRERLQELYTSEAAEYVIYRDASRKDKVELRNEPIYVWTNPIRDGQDGGVFVWTCRGRAEVVGSIFCMPAIGQRQLQVFHEFHSLSLSVLDVQRPGTHTWNWTPLAPGIELAPIAGAPAPARSGPLRLSQMRTLSHDFAASTRDHQERRWELRLLPQPLYRYESTDPDVLDGAVFGFVTSAGTDLEALVVIEARKPNPTETAVWRYAIARFTDVEMRVRIKGKEVFTCPLIPYNLPQQDPKHRYRVYHDRDIPPIAEEVKR